MREMKNKQSEHQLKRLFRNLMAFRSYLAGNWLEYIVVTLAFVLLTFAFTNWVVFDVSHKLFINEPGDATSGFLWLNYADQDLNPKLGYTTMVNYPEGIGLNSPTYITYSALWLPLWVLSRAFTPVVALNIVTFWGFVSGALAMYWLMKRMTRNIWIAFFAGFAVAFVPYHVFKSSAHLAYLFSVVFVLILAAFLAFWQKPTRLRAVLLAAAMALAFYTDGYYLLLASVFLVILIAGGVLYGLLARVNDFFKTLLVKARFLLLAFFALVVFMLPVAFVQLKYGSQVAGTLSQARSDIRMEMDYYGSKPVDFLLPPKENILLGDSDWFKSLHEYKDSRSNASESTLYAGYVVWALCLIGGSMALALLFKGRHTLTLLSASERRNYLFLGLLTLVSVLLLTFFTLPPRIYIGNTGLFIPTLAEFLIQFDIAYWRVLPRFFLPMHIMLVAFAALTLWVLLRASTARVVRVAVRNTIQALVVAGLLLVLALEYGTSIHRPSFDFNKMPQAYTWLKDQDDIEAIAEFPFVSKVPWQYSSYAVTAQMIHDKKLINLHLPNQDAGRRNAFGLISNPEAVDYVARRGAQIAVTHDRPCNLTYPWLELAYDGSKETSSTCMYYIEPATEDGLFAFLKSGFGDAPLIQGDSYYSLLYGNYAEIWTMDYNDKFVQVTTPAVVEMGLVNVPGQPVFDGTWQLLQDEVEIVGGHMVDGRTVHIKATVDANRPIQLRIKQHDGSDPDVYQLGLVNIKITEQ